MRGRGEKASDGAGEVSNLIGAFAKVLLNRENRNVLFAR